MQIKFTVTIDVERTEGMNASRQNVIEALADYPDNIMEGASFDVESCHGEYATYETVNVEFDY